MLSWRDTCKWTQQTYRALVEEMLAAKRMAESKMDLYLSDDSTYLYLYQIEDLRIREAHRHLMAFLRKQVSDEKIDAMTRRSLAETLCSLIRASVLEENELGEQVIIQGSANGWDYDKLWLLVRAGADVHVSGESAAARLPYRTKPSPSTPAPT